MITVSKALIESTFSIFERAAINGERCPKNIDRHVPDGKVHLRAVAELVAAGRIRTEVFGRNFRRATILTGPNAGKKTAAFPGGGRPWKVSDKTGTRMHRKAQPSTLERDRSKIGYAGAPR